VYVLKASTGEVLRVIRGLSGPTGVAAATDGTAFAAVPMPTGLEFHRGTLYASAFSVGIFFGLPDAGQIVKVNPSAFASP